MTISYYNHNGHCWRLRPGQTEPDEAANCLHCGVSYMGTGPACDAPCEAPMRSFEPVAKWTDGVARYPNALDNVTLTGKHLVRLDLTLPKTPKLVVDSEAWSNIRSGGQTALLVVSKSVLGGTFEISAGPHKPEMRCRVTRCLRIGFVGVVECCPIWLVCLKVVAHAERHARQARELGRLNHEVWKLARERDELRRKAKEK